MKLSDIVTALDERAISPHQGRDPEVSGIAYDSRNVQQGYVFVAVRGFHSDGHHFVPQAVARGAVAVVVEQGSDITGGAGVPVIPVRDSRRALARIAAAFYGHPSLKLGLVGITGTNGKTTTTYLARSVIEAAGGRVGLIGTIDYRVGDRVYPAPNTTPESLDIQRLLAEMAAVGATHCVMEVSSHALALGRTEECVFRAAAFTNLTQDHLDFHKDIESYLQAKLLLFAGLPPTATAVVNQDDARSADIIGSTRARLVTYGLSGQADIRPSGDIRQGIDGLAFDVETPKGIVAIRSPLVGRHNVLNILCAAGIGVALGLSPAAISQGIGAMTAVPGRMEKIDEGQPFGLIVDYAHTEDALARLLEAVREVAPGRIITIFGCGGDRDRTKRPKMGAVAVNGSDLVIVTSDNPRTEDPMVIIKEIEGGMCGAGMRVSPPENEAAPAGKTPYLVIPDRRAAVDAAVSLAKTGDVIVLAGKGHEDYQIFGDRKVHFDDREEAREAIRRRQQADSRPQTVDR